MKINKLLTKVNFKKVYNKSNKYIVIHYVGATGGAKDNCRYFEKEYRGASAHYFVGHNGEVWQCVEDKNVSWHCGANVYKHPYCRNSNSIGIEMCCYMLNGKWCFDEKTVASTLELVKELMKKYNIPEANVIRHYDVTGKVCPEPFVSNATAWNNFKAKLKPTKTVVNITSIAKEVINGKWGNGDTRKKRLTDAGYNYAEVQAEVNRLLRG